MEENKSYIDKAPVTLDTTKSKRNVLPNFTFDEMLAFCSKIYTELGFNTYHSKELIAKIHGLAYASIKQKLSTSQDYGLLEIKHGIGYKLTPLFLKIFKPINESERFQGTIEALQTCDTYKLLIQEINGHPIPSEQGLSSRFIRNFDLKDGAAAKAANIFLQNLREGGFVNSQGILHLDFVSEQLNKPTVKTDEKSTDFTQPNNLPVTLNSQHSIPYSTEKTIEIPIPLKGGKRAYIRIPEDYSEEDCDRIAKFVDALK